MSKIWKSPNTKFRHIICRTFKCYALSKLKYMLHHFLISLLIQIDDFDNKLLNASNWPLCSLRGITLLRTTHASHVCSQHSFGLPLRMNGMQRTQFDHARLDPLSLVIWSRMFWLSVTWNLGKAQRWSKSVLTFDRCRPHSVTFGYY